LPDSKSFTVSIIQPLVWFQSSSGKLQWRFADASIELGQASIKSGQASIERGHASMEVCGRLNRTRASFNGGLRMLQSNSGMLQWRFADASIELGKLQSSLGKLQSNAGMLQWRFEHASMEVCDHPSPHKLAAPRFFMKEDKHLFRYSVESLSNWFPCQFLVSGAGANVLF